MAHQAKNNRELPVPPAAVHDPAAHELIRVWGTSNKQFITLRADEWDDAAAWGLLLVDIARNVARAYAQRAGVSIDEASKRIRDGFDAEWSFPTS